VFDQAAHRLHTAQDVLSALVNGSLEGARSPELVRSK